MKTKILLIPASIIMLAANSQAADGKPLFEKNCAICHGKDGTGQTPMGTALKARNFTEGPWQDTVKDEDIVKTINEGRLDKATGKEKMKPFAKLLSADDIKTLVGYVRTFKGGPTAGPASPRTLDIGPLAKEPGAAPTVAAAPAGVPVAAVAAPATVPGGGQLDLISHAYVLASLGSYVEQQNALATLASQETPVVDMIILQAMDKLLAGQVRAELQLDFLEVARKRSAPIIKEKIQKFEASRSTGNPLSYYSDVVAGGNAEAGHNVFFDKPESGCIACHTISGRGGAVGPNLTGIGARKSRQYLIESLVDPNKDIAEGFLNMTITTQDGKKYSGLVKKETDKALIIASAEDGDIEVAKANIAASERTASPMPPDLAKALPRRDLRDLLEFLCSLKDSLPANTPLLAASPPSPASPGPAASPQLGKPQARASSGFE